MFLPKPRKRRTINTLQAVLRRAYSRWNKFLLKTEWVCK